MIINTSKEPAPNSYINSINNAFSVDHVLSNSENYTQEEKDNATFSNIVIKTLDENSEIKNNTFQTVEEAKEFLKDKTQTDKDFPAKITNPISYLIDIAGNQSIVKLNILENIDSNSTNSSFIKAEKSGEQTFTIDELTNGKYKAEDGWKISKFNDADVFDIETGLLLSSITINLDENEVLNYRLTVTNDKCTDYNWNISLEEQEKIIECFRSLDIEPNISFYRDGGIYTRSNDQHSVGIDRGGVVAVATSDGKSITPDIKLTSQWDKKRTYHQKKMSKMRSRALNSAKKEFISKNPNDPKDEISHKAHQAGKEAMYQVMKGVQYQHHKERANHYSSKIFKYREAWQQEVTTALVRSSDRIVLEDLKVKNMTRKGGKRKRGMNRSFLAFSPARFATMLEYKTLLSGGELIFIPPHHTSQRCNECGYTAKENRESQAVFVCKNCKNKDNADNNAALNIRDYADYLYGLYQGTDLSASEETQENGSGAIIRAKPSKEDVEGFYTWKQPDCSDAINPSSVV